MKFHELVWGLIGCVLLTLLFMHAPRVNQKFASWLSTAGELNCQYIDTHRRIVK